MRVDDIKRQNENYYYCRNYASLFNRTILVFPLLSVLLMGCVSLYIRSLFLTQSFYLEAAAQNLGTVDVMQWINERKKEGNVDIMLLVILVVSVALFLFILVCTLKIKSYDLYKRRWIRVIPVLLYAAQTSVMLLYYFSKTLGRQLPLLFLAVIAEIVPVLVSSRVLFSTESRPKARGEAAWNFIFSLLEKSLFEHI